MGDVERVIIMILSDIYRDKHFLDTKAAMIRSNEKKRYIKMAKELGVFDKPLKEG